MPYNRQYILMFKAVAIGNEEPGARFKQGADVIMCV